MISKILLLILLLSLVLRVMWAKSPEEALGRATKALWGREGRGRASEARPGQLRGAAKPTSQGGSREFQGTPEIRETHEMPLGEPALKKGLQASATKSAVRGLEELPLRGRPPTTPRGRQLNRVVLRTQVINERAVQCNYF